MSGGQCEESAGVIRWNNPLNEDTQNTFTEDHPMPKLKKTQRTKRGSVSILARAGMLRLRWTYQGKEYQIALGLRDSPYHRTIAQKKASEIEADIAYGVFDVTLAKYKPQEASPVPEQLSTIHLFERFIVYRQQQGTSGQAITSRYKPLCSNLTRFNRTITTEQDAQDFVNVLRSRQSPKISNQNLSLLRGFCEWAIESGHLKVNPFATIKPVKGTRSRRQPFSRDEIARILQTTKFHSAYSSYHDFTYVLLSLGLRPSEAIGLRWQHIDLARKQITINESLSRSTDGRSSGTARQRKITKTGNIRTLTLHEQLVLTFAGRKPLLAKPDDLVFTSSRGFPIDDHNFSQRVWKRLLTDAGVDYRPPYNSRHSFTSHLIEQGASFSQAAETLGHSSSRVVADTYAHMVNRPVMPEF